MKALLYKEFKLAMHPMCYVFIACFPLMILIPSYPIAVGFIYVLSCYPILFLGANKGQQSNDLLFSTLLPVRKKDIVMARMITIMIMHFAFAALCSCLAPLAYIIQQNIQAEGGEAMRSAGFPISGFVSTLAFVFVGYGFADLIFFPIYYKHGKSIVASTLLTILGFVIYIGIFTIGLPIVSDSIEAMKWFNEFFCGPIWKQFIVLAVALLIYFALHILVYKISAKELEKVDF